MKKILVLLISIFLLTGCSDYTELENLGITSSLFIEYDIDYKITAEIYKDDEMEYLSSKGSTISEAIHNFNFKSKSKIYLSHLNALILSEDVPIEEVLYYFLRNPNSNNNFYVVVTDQEDFYDEEENVGLMLNNILDRSNRDDFFVIMRDYLNKNKDIVIPFMSKDYNLDTIATYKKDKLINNLSKENTFIYSLLTDKTSEETLKVSYEDKDIVVSIDNIKTDIKVDKNIQIKLDIDATILEKDGNLNTFKAKTITNIEKKINASLENDLKKFINTLKDDKTDILGINTLINNKYKKIDKTFDKYNYDFKVSLSINKKGQLLK